MHASIPGDPPQSTLLGFSEAPCPD